MEKIVRLTPIIYAFLIFAGYLDYATYYRQFHIPIVSYLSTTELLLSFLTITPPLLFLILLISIVLIMILSSISGNIKHNETDLNVQSLSFIFQFKEDGKRIFEIIRKFKLSFQTIFDLLLFIGHFCLSFISLLFFIFYLFIVLPFLVESNSMTGSVLSFGFPFSILWFMLFINIVIVAIEKIQKKYATPILFISLVFSYLALMIIYNKQKSSNILAGKGEYAVTLELDNRIVSTDTSFLYVGKTEKYFFFFDKTNNKNVIYSTDQAKNIQIKFLGNMP